jgi:hypothetical protein
LKNLTIRSVSPKLAEALEREKARRGVSLNQTVLDLLEQGLGVTGARSNSLARLAGSWTEDQHREFMRAVEPFQEVDAELWG